MYSLFLDNDMAFSGATPLKLSSLVAAEAVVLYGCGDGKEMKAATQMAAEVDSSGISVNQINAVLARRRRRSKMRVP